MLLLLAGVRIGKSVVNRIVECIPPGEVGYSAGFIYRDTAYSTWRKGRILISTTLRQSNLALVDHVSHLKSGLDINQPIYSYLTCTRSTKPFPCPAKCCDNRRHSDFTDPNLRDLMDIKVFVDADADDRLSRVICAT